MTKAVQPKKGASNGVVSLKVTLRGTRPPVWRRLLIPSTMTLAELHQAIQAAMGWEDCHLHAFDIAGRQYGDVRIRQQRRARGRGPRRSRSRRVVRLRSPR